MRSSSLCDEVFTGLEQGVRGVGVLVWCTSIITNLAASDKDCNRVLNTFSKRIDRHLPAQTRGVTMLRGPDSQAARPGIGVHLGELPHYRPAG